MSFINITVAVSNGGDELGVVVAPKLNKWNHLRSNSVQEDFDGFIHEDLCSLLEISSIISKDSVFLQPVKSHDCAAIHQMSLEFFIGKVFNGLSEDEESDDFDVELSHFDDVKCHDLVGDLFFRTFSAVDCFHCFGNAYGAENSESFINLINGSEVFSSRS